MGGKGVREEGGGRKDIQYNFEDDSLDSQAYGAVNFSQHILWLNLYRDLA